MQVEVSPEAAAPADQRSERLWVWAARPRMCCAGIPADMHPKISRVHECVHIPCLTSGDAASVDGPSAASSKTS
jgi:hypothetical protein